MKKRLAQLICLGLGILMMALGIVVGSPLNQWLLVIGFVLVCIVVVVFFRSARNNYLNDPS